MKKIVNKSLIKKIIDILICAILIIVLFVVGIQKISNNRLSFFGYRIFRVVSESMTPEYEINDILLVKNTDVENIEIGNDISYLKKFNEDVEIIITHRIVNIEKNSEGELIFHTKGIANSIEDSIVTEEQIYGIVITKIYTLSFIVKLINNIYGFILLVFIPLLVIICSNIKKLIILYKENNDEK